MQSLYCTSTIKHFRRFGAFECTGHQCLDKTTVITVAWTCCWGLSRGGAPSATAGKCLTWIFCSQANYFQVTNYSEAGSYLLHAWIFRCMHSICYTLAFQVHAFYLLHAWLHDDGCIYMFARIWSTNLHNYRQVKACTVHLIFVCKMPQSYSYFTSKYWSLHTSSIDLNWFT